MNYLRGVKEEIEFRMKSLMNESFEHTGDQPRFFYVYCVNLGQICSLLRDFEIMFGFELDLEKLCSSYEKTFDGLGEYN